MGKTFSEQIDIFSDESLLLEEACKNLGDTPDCGTVFTAELENSFTQPIETIDDEVFEAISELEDVLGKANTALELLSDTRAKLQALQGREESLGDLISTMAETASDYLEGHEDFVDRLQFYLNVGNTTNTLELLREDLGLNDNQLRTLKEMLEGI